jgi:glutathione S-transferase
MPFTDWFMPSAGPSTQATPLAECRREWNSEDNKDVVIFHIFPRTALSPSMSPFVLKLETFLRMHDVKYKVDHKVPMNPVTQKSPWITFNGEDVADSQHIMDFLSEKLSLLPKYDLDANPKDKIVARGLRSILEDHFNFCMVSMRMIHGKYEDIAPCFPTIINVKMVQKFVIKRIMKSMGSQAKAQGIGRYPKETVLKMANEDLEILSLALGEKNFIMGDEPSELDCAVFAFLVLNLDDFVTKPKNDEEKETKEGEENEAQKASEPVVDADDKYKNLQEYIPRMKERFWSDWDDLCKEAEEALAKKEKGKKSEEKEPEDTENAKETDEAKGAAKIESSPGENEEEKKDKEK